MSNSRQTEHPIHPLFTDRWSPRAFTGEAIPAGELMSLLEAARWAPSAYNAQPWRFIYAHRDTPAWQPLFDALVPFNQGWVQRAAAIIVVVSAEQAVFPGKTAPAPNAWHSFDSGAAWASLAFQAQLSGWAAHGMAGFDADTLRQAAAIPAGYAIEAVVAVGRQGDKSVLPEPLQAREVPSHRRPLAQSVAEGRFNFAE
ncbi:nitroreductase family protein [Aquabacterium sp. J223]|uniref:nitroreductase family protein n=1 Tax=Aquabacterium sp. J223 TaxID=2898431 RepID=UPI0021AE0133|nr:nitroreductase family protein [Aquabacterium sp. J223]UUX96931.1 nitroreductase family protein [Aquabacterium sp. J223]